MTKTLTKAQLLKLAKNETDTVRSAHFRRMAEGADGIGHLTVKDDTKREKRDELIAGLKPIKPVVEQYDGPREPHSNDIAVLQKQVDDLKADTVDLSGQLSGAQKALEGAVEQHSKEMSVRDDEKTKLVADHKLALDALSKELANRAEQIAVGETKLVEASEELKTASEKLEALAKDHEAELAESAKVIADRDKEISELKSAVADRDTQIEDLTKPKEDA